ncbi:MAG: methylase domain protein [Planctomycetaceae bacterium]|nr:methylase domain protein [Planctomycetaceae bacterium]
MNPVADLGIPLIPGVRVESQDSGIDLVEAANLLAALTERGVSFVIVGSLASYWLSSNIPERLPNDIDILVPNQIASLNLLVQCLLDMEFVVYSWGDQIRTPIDPDHLRGRFYLRAIRVSGSGGRLVLDATYESPLLPFADAWQRRIPVSQFAIASPADLNRLQWPRQPAAGPAIDELLHPLTP